MSSLLFFPFDCTFPLLDSFLKILKHVTWVIFKEFDAIVSIGVTIHSLQLLNLSSLLSGCREVFSDDGHY